MKIILFFCKAFIKRFYDSCASEGRKISDIEKIDSTLTVEKTTKSREINTPFNYSYGMFSNGDEIRATVEFFYTQTNFHKW